MAFFVMANVASFHRLCGRDAQCLPVEATLSKKLTHAQNGKDCFLAFLGYDNQFDVALLDVERRVGDVALRKDVLTGAEFQVCLARPHSGEKNLGIERCLGSFAQIVVLRARRVMTPAHLVLASTGGRTKKVGVLSWATELPL